MNTDSTNMELPELDEGLLDEAGFRALCAEVERLTELDQVLVKGSPARYTPDTNWQLPAARDALIAGQARGIQLRYRYDGQAWFDTVLKTPDGYKVVRMQQR